MPKTLLGQPRRILALGLAALLALVPASGGFIASAATPPSGLLCTTSGSPNAAFTLTAESGYVSMPDGNVILAWSYSPTTAFQFPGPMLCVNQGDSVTIVLNNRLAEPVSLIFPGLDNVSANGAPAQPQFSGGVLTSLTPAAPANGSATYSFVASRPGTYLYESGTDPGKQVQMGLYGALVVRPTLGASYAYGIDSQFNPTTEYVLLLSELDPALHQAVERGQPYNVTTLHPRYWLINGRTFPDTIAPNNAAWLPTQPYSALVHMHPKDASNPKPALIRYVNAGGRNHPFHPHGQNGRVLARDAHPLVSSAGQDLSFETFAFTIGSGQTWDISYAYENQEGWNPVNNPIPITVPQVQNLAFKGNETWYSGSPYLGYQDLLPVGVTSYNRCGEYYMVFHSHALFEVANFDASFGGMLTLQRIDPPVPNACP
jgi:FtsP/CotA-like multicopper oxidase with cupredoxin domain